MRPQFALPTLLLIVSCSISFAAGVADKTIAIPLPSKGGASSVVKKPASDLIKDGAMIDAGHAAQLASQGFDLSMLNPAENKLWQNKKYSTSNAEEFQYPSASAGVRFLSMDGESLYTYFAKSQSNENSGRFFRLVLSRFSQPMMMRAALLRKLGYYVPSPRYYKNLRVSFASEIEKEAFIRAAQDMNDADFESRSWILENNTQNHSLVLASATLEVVSSDTFDIQWGNTPDPENPKQLPMILEFSKRRAWRALLVPYVLTDFPESINRYPVNFGILSSGYVQVSHYRATSFSAASYEDIVWILRRLAALDEQDYREIVQEGNYPEELQDLVLSKLMYRANSALEAFGLAPSFSYPDLDISNAQGTVQNGKVMQEFFPGYPQRFAHTRSEADSPYQPGDIGRFLKVDALSSLIATVAGKINEKVQALTVQDAIEEYQNKLRGEIIDHLRHRPNEPFYKKVAAWHGPLAGLNVNSSRHVSTGTYAGFGSSAAVQLVDNISVGANIGYFAGLDGIEKYMPSAGVHLAVVRDYTHVRPILSMKEVDKISWGDLAVPSYMDRISKILESETYQTEGQTQQSLDGFLKDLRDGEVFTVTDSVALGAYLQASSSIDVLLGLNPIGFLTSVSAGVDAGRVILRQVSFMRVNNQGFSGVHVYVRDIRNSNFGFNFDVNYYVRLLNIRSQLTESNIHSDGFIIAYDPVMAADADQNSEMGQKFLKVRENLRLAFRSLLKSNSTEILEAKFKSRKFEIDHRLNTSETKIKFLIWRYSDFAEDHLLKLRYPISEKHPQLNPKDEEITLFSSKRGRLTGTDYLGGLIDIGQSILESKDKDITLATALSSNPANTPYGSAFWRMVDSQSDLSVNREQYPNVSLVQHVWGGWSLSKKKFLKLIDQIESEFQASGLTSYRIIDRNDFLTVKTLDFYRITANLSILDSGLEKIKQLVLQPQLDSKNSSNGTGILEKWINKLFKIKPRKDRSENDRSLFTALMKILGNGDAVKGLKAYNKTCTPNDEAMLDEDEQKFSCIKFWVQDLMDLGARFPESSKQDQAKWMTKVLSVLDRALPLPQILKHLGEDNYIFLIRVNGYRSGDEDGDLEYFSNSVGDPAKDYKYAGGLTNLLIKKTGLIPFEIERTNGDFQ